MKMSGREVWWLAAAVVFAPAIGFALVRCVWCWVRKELEHAAE